MSRFGRAMGGILITLAFTVVPVATAAAATSAAGTGVLACEVGYEPSAYTGGFTAQITIGNTGTVPIDGWTFRFPVGDGVEVTEFWNARLLSRTGLITAQHQEYNRVVAPDSVIHLGFVARGPAGATPARFTVNDVVCAAA